MVSRLKIVGTRENVGELRGIMDQDGKVLGANPQTRPLKPKRDEGNLFRIPLTYQTSCIVVRHCDLLMFMELPTTENVRGRENQLKEKNERKDLKISAGPLTGFFAVFYSVLTLSSLAELKPAIS